MEAVLGYLARLLLQLSEWLRRLRSDAENWRQGPPGYTELWRATLKHNGAAYTRVLARFDAHCRQRGVVLETAADVDAVASASCCQLGRVRPAPC